MRLLYLADPFLPVPPEFYGGIERIIDSIMRGAQARGHEVALLAHPESRVQATLYPLAGGARPSRGDILRNLSRVRKAAEEFRPDLIHNFGRLLYLAPFFFSSLPKIMAFNREPTAKTVRWAARLAGKTLTFTGCSESITQRGAARGGNWEAVPNGIELDRYSFRACVPRDAPLVFLSRLERVKGAHHAIAAARAAGRKLILAGNRTASGHEADYWEREIAPQIGRDGISYVGPVDDRRKNELLGSALALLVPIGWEEPFGLVFAEALACGTPVISFRRGALPEIIREGREGFLCNGPDELPEAIRQVATLDRTRCRARAEERFSSTLMCERYENLYRRLVSPA
jgi:glycosyltransferase involved in cell wall biosynthesis